MLKHLLPGALLLAALPALAQTAPRPAAIPAGPFCVVRSLGVVSDSRPSFTLDVGALAKGEAEPLVSQNFKRQNLHSAADMLNYMDYAGWELLHTTAVASNWPTGSLPSLEYQYVFRRKAN